MNKKFLIGIITLILAISLCISPLAAGDWTTFQGNVKHTGYNSGESDAVASVWSTNLDNGAISSSPVIHDNLLYVITEEGILKVIDITDNTIEWTYDFEDKVVASPIIKGDILYVGDCDGDFYALNISSELNDDDHDTIWETNLPDPIKSTATIKDDTVYVGCDDGFVYAFDNNGDEKWSYELEDKVSSSPIIAEDTLYVGSTNGKLVALDLSGNEKWTYTTADKIVSSPAYFDDTVMVGSEDGNLYCINTADGALNWSVSMENKILSSPMIDSHNNNVYIGADTGNISCFDTRDGTFKWGYETGGEVQSTPALYNDEVIVNSNDGNTYVLNKYTGKVDLKFNPGCYLFNSKITASPVVYGDSLFVADTAGYLHSIDLNKEETPVTNFLYYDIIVLIVVIIIIAVIIKVAKKSPKTKSKRSKKGKK